MAAIEMSLPVKRLSLPSLLDGFVTPRASRSDADQPELYVTWTQVQAFLRMAEEALRAKNLAHEVTLLWDSPLTTLVGVAGTFGGTSSRLSVRRDVHRTSNNMSSNL
jgi:hypothetical protein